MMQRRVLGKLHLAEPHSTAYVKSLYFVIFVSQIVELEVCLNMLLSVANGVAVLAL